MTYTSKWERLSDALDRVMKSTDLSRGQAETDICGAISDRAIGVRAKLAKHAVRPLKSQAVVDGDDLRIPTQLKPHDLDWQQSRPTNPWLIRDLPPLHHGPWHLDWLELFTADVTRELLPYEKSSLAAGSKAQIKTTRKKRETPKLEAARAAVEALFGIPKMF